MTLLFCNHTCHGGIAGRARSRRPLKSVCVTRVRHEQANRSQRRDLVQDLLWRHRRGVRGLERLRDPNARGTGAACRILANPPDARRCPQPGPIANVRRLAGSLDDPLGDVRGRTVPQAWPTHLGIWPGADLPRHAHCLASTCLHSLVCGLDQAGAASAFWERANSGRTVRTKCHLLVQSPLRAARRDLPDRRCSGVRTAQGSPVKSCCRQIHEIGSRSTDTEVFCTARDFCPCDHWRSHVHRRTATSASFGQLGILPGSHLYGHVQRLALTDLRSPAPLLVRPASKGPFRTQCFQRPLTSVHVAAVLSRRLHGSTGVPQGLHHTPTGLDRAPPSGEIGLIPFFT